MVPFLGHPVYGVTDRLLYKVVPFVTVLRGLFVGVQATDVLDEFMSRHSSTSKGIMAVDKNLSEQQKKEEGKTHSLIFLF